MIFKCQLSILFNTGKFVTVSPVVRYPGKIRLVHLSLVPSAPPTCEAPCAFSPRWLKNLNKQLPDVWTKQEVGTPDWYQVTFAGHVVGHPSIFFYQIIMMLPIAVTYLMLVDC